MRKGCSHPIHSNIVSPLLIIYWSMCKKPFSCGHYINKYIHTIIRQLLCHDCSVLFDILLYSLRISNRYGSVTVLKHFFCECVLFEIAGSLVNRTGQGDENNGGSSANDSLLHPAGPAARRHPRGDSATADYAGLHAG
jgi:hypothetical protein